MIASQAICSRDYDQQCHCGMYAKKIRNEEVIKGHIYNQIMEIVQTILSLILL